jgi:hypothetical protein
LPAIFKVFYFSSDEQKQISSYSVNVKTVYDIKVNIIKIHRIIEVVVLLYIMKREINIQNQAIYVSRDANQAKSAFKPWVTYFCNKGLIRET